jgi:hypothetical protein
MRRTEHALMPDGEYTALEQILRGLALSRFPLLQPRGPDRQTLLHNPLSPRKLNIMRDHHSKPALESDPRFPAKNVVRFSCISPQGIDLCGPEIPPVNLVMAPPVEPSRSEGQLDKISHTMRLPGGYAVVGLLLQHEPHSFDMVAREPVDFVTFPSENSVK